MTGSVKRKASSSKKAKPSGSKKAKPSVAGRLSLDATSPKYGDILALLNALIPASDANIGDAPHGAFWLGENGAPLDRNAFVAIDVGQWQLGVTGPLIKPGTPDASNFYLALAGKPPFDGSVVSRMPDINADPNARFATADEIQMVATWIKGGAPA